MDNKSTIDKYFEQEKHNIYMSRALELADICLEYGDIPIGALIVKHGEIIGEGYNTVEKENNPMAHAEINAINNAVKNLGYKHLLNCDMYVTLEPCSMCAGAIVLARIKNLYIGAKDSKTGACGSVFNIVQEKHLNHQLNVEYDILEQECSAKISLFFKQMRSDRRKRN